MGKQKVVDKTITPLQAVSLNPLVATEGRSRGSLGFLPIGYYRGSAAFWDLDKAVNQPLIWAEKQWTEDRVDTRNGSVKITVPAGTTKGSKVTGTIEVAADELWYLCCHELMIAQASGLTAGDLIVNFRVSSFPKVNDADKLYYDENDPKAYLTANGVKVASGGLLASQAEIAAGHIFDHKLLEAGQYWKITNIDQTSGDVTATLEKQYREVQRDFRECDELNTELRLPGGAILTLVAEVSGADVAGDDIDVYLRVYGRVAKVLVS